VIVHAGGRVEVVLPRRAPRSLADELLVQHAKWIERQRERLAPTLRLPRISERDGRRLARELADDLCRAHARRIGVEYGRIRIADQRTRWGSCSLGRTLSFNWRLVLAPQPVFEYVVVHELCHLREPNHSQRFWDLVEHAWPAYQRDEAWLRRHGHELLAYEPVASAPALQLRFA
jgi:predicted metal-dependent hydrolase